MVIEKILVANRGEIALRAIRTIKEMGKKAIAVYSKADKDALYLKYADASICIGEAASTGSYLNIPAIISAAEISGCDAIFPGYGFLSENQSFVEICGHHEIKFIGPSVDAMILMSDKSKAKEVMKKAGVPVIEGSDGALKDVAQAKELARKIGYPVIVKASAGGGGRGMRVVEREEDMEVAYLSAENESATAFGDGTLYLEKFIKDPRHIEVQVIGDAHGGAIHIGERDCSLQRRHQKLIEESPSFRLPEKIRQEMGEAAVRLAKAINYDSAGTFEFLLDENNNFYFMEMNTRIQVEHTVTEAVTGLDIIKLQIVLAEGDILKMSQEDIVPYGHAIECRINAEDTEHGFLPCPGKITKYIVPGGIGIRIDSHTYQGYEISPYYDSMIGKVIAFGMDREEAIARMKRALNEFIIEGVETTIPFHLKVLENENYKKGNVTTAFIEKEFGL